MLSVKYAVGLLTIYMRMKKRNDMTHWTKELEKLIKEPPGAWYRKAQTDAIVDEAKRLLALKDVGGLVLAGFRKRVRRILNGKF